MERCGLLGLQASTVAKRPVAQWPNLFSERTPNILATLIITMFASENIYILFVSLYAFNMFAVCFGEWDLSNGTMAV